MAVPRDCPGAAGIGLCRVCFLYASIQASVTPDEINYCLRCGSRLAEEERFGRLRPVCPACGWIYFADPKVAAAVVVEKGDDVLLVRRAYNPERGRWALPAGFIDAGEDPRQAAERECLEETGLVVQVTALLEVLFGQDHARGANIIIIYKADILSGELQPGDDVDGAAFFARDALPPLAFSATRHILGAGL
jgi:ADP-ribose pyrophosphatase YjhB (NUDIX family)